MLPVPHDETPPIERHPSAGMSTAEQPTEKAPKETLQQWYKSANDIMIGPTRRKRMPAGRHAVVVSPPAKFEAQAQDEARKQSPSS